VLPSVAPPRCRWTRRSCSRPLVPRRPRHRCPRMPRPPPPPSSSSCSSSWCPCSPPSWTSSRPPHRRHRSTKNIRLKKESHGLFRWVM
jgi:hypothetical protein